MMKATHIKKPFVNKENNDAAEPLLLPGDNKMKVTSSSDHDEGDNNGASSSPVGASDNATKRGALKTILSSALAPRDRTSTDSTVPITPDVSPRAVRRELLSPPSPAAAASPSRSPRGPMSKENKIFRPRSIINIPPSPPKSRGRKDPSYRHHISPTSIALNCRSATLPSSFSSPSLSSHLLEEHHGRSDEGGTDNDVPIKKIRSEGVSSTDRRTVDGSYDCNYKHAISQVFEDFGVERKLVELKPSHVAAATIAGKQKAKEVKSKPKSSGLLPKSISNEKKKSTVRKSNPVDIDGVSDSNMSSSPHLTEEYDVMSKPCTSLANHPELNQMGMEQVSKTKLPKAISSPSSPRKVVNVPTRTRGEQISVTHSLPTESEIRSLRHVERLHTERLLNQMGMDVTENDYCIEGEFARKAHGSPLSQQDHGRDSAGGNRGSRGRAHSYDCNYSHQIEVAYEDFGVERRLVELHQPELDNNQGRHGDKKKHGKKGRSIKKLVKSSIRIIGNTSLSDSEQPDQQQKDGKFKTRVLSLLRGNAGSSSSTKRRSNTRVPNQIVASFTPNSTKDNDENYDDVDEALMTPQDLQLLYRWQTARMMRSNNNAQQPTNAGGGITKPPNMEKLAQSSVGSSECVLPQIHESQNNSNVLPEDLLSVTSSVGEKTVMADNRRRQSNISGGAGPTHRPGFSF